ncbi:alpha/beta-type small acid-soluble spore protein [Oceanobacillus senegalensis]|uniref:alpha/beta-type small acid-soluble spore protein n=1 Tax=Oceanobacillus senegalensis TaxID=1936063 RepID=UPI000A30DBE4|nr:alpha/beta-type small acid-soluble spore protein [Oceanobacillus senegalensis]
MAKRKILVPEAREGLDQLKAKVTNTIDPKNTKYEIADEQGISLNHGYNGDIKAKEAGKIGGEIGGNMVKELVSIAKKQMNR